MPPTIVPAMPASSRIWRRLIDAAEGAGWADGDAWAEGCEGLLGGNPGGWWGSVIDAALPDHEELGGFTGAQARLLDAHRHHAALE